MGFRKSFQKVYKGRCGGLCCCICAIVLALLLWSLLRASRGTYFAEGFTGASEFVFYHMNGCPHCVNMMPEWAKFEDNNDTGIKTRKTERGEAPDEVKKYGIKGFPALVLLDDNGDKIKDYSGPRNAKGFAAFCAENA